MTSISYHTIEDTLFGEINVEQSKYDLMEVVVVNLGDAEGNAELGILDLLNTLFSPKIKAADKKKVLSEKYNIAMTEELEREVQRMCNLSTAIANEARVEGVDLMAKLMKILLAEKRYSDAERASDDAEYRDKLMKEYKLID